MFAKPFELLRLSEIYESVYIIMEKFWNEVVIKLNNPDVWPFAVESELLLKCNVTS